MCISIYLSKSTRATSRKQAERCLGKTALCKNVPRCVFLFDVPRCVTASCSNTIQQFLPGDMECWICCKAKAAFRTSLSYALEAGPYHTQLHTRFCHTAHSRADRCNYSSPKSHDVPKIQPPVTLLLFHTVMLLLQAPKRLVSSFIRMFPAAHCGLWTP